MEKALQGTLNAMGGEEFLPQMSPYKPKAHIRVMPASDKGWDIAVTVEDFITGESAEHNPDHLAVGYPYLFIDGEKMGRLYGNAYHVPELSDGEHIIGVYFEQPNGGLYRTFGKPIGTSILLNIGGGKAQIWPL